MPPRFYYSEKLLANSRVLLPESIAKHAVNALRLQNNAPIILFDGFGGQFAAYLQIEGKKAWANVGHWQEKECESTLEITLIQALQSGDKMDFTIQKAVELGVFTIVPVSSARSVLRLTNERAARKLAHWQGIIIAACEQCGRNKIPAILPVESFTKTLAKLAAATISDHEKRFYLSPAATDSFAAQCLEFKRQIESRALKITLLIGAEGGFSPEEEDLAKAAGFIAARLGARVLRTETASIAALASLQTLCGDFC